MKIAIFLFLYFSFTFFFPAEDIFGLLIPGILLFVPIFFTFFQKNRRLLFFFIFAILIREMGVFFNSYISEIPGTEHDARNFHQLAIAGDWRKFVPGTWFFVAFLSGIYSFFGDSFLLGNQLGVISFLFTTALIFFILKELGIRKSSFLTICLFFFLPTQILWGCTTSREPYQLFVFLALMFFSLVLRRTKKPLSLIGFFSATLILPFLHHIFHLTTIVFFGMALFFITKLDKLSPRRKVLFSIIFITFVVLSLSGRQNPYGRDLSPFSFFSTLKEHRLFAKSQAPEARAYYGTIIDDSSWMSQFVSFLFVPLCYFFAPFPWQISSIFDFYAFLENFLRFFLIIFSLKQIRTTSGETKRKFSFCMIFFFTLEFLWSLGTINWGTALRHHLVAYPILVIIGGPGLIRFLKSRLRKKPTSDKSSFNHRTLRKHGKEPA